MKPVFYSLGAVFLSAIFPGAGHLFIGSRKRSYALLVYTLIFPVLLYKFSSSLFPQSATAFVWISSLLFLLFVASIIFAIFDVLLLLKKKIEGSTYSPLPKHRLGRFLLLILVILIVNFVSDWIAPRNIWFYQVSPAGVNMSPTLIPGDRIVVVDKGLDPEKLRNAVVTHRYSELGEMEKVYIRRVAALPGEKAVWNDSEQIVPNGEIYLTGDNEINSLDSRQLGPFKLNSIVGRAAFIFYSSHWKRIGKLVE